MVPVGVRPHGPCTLTSCMEEGFPTFYSQNKIVERLGRRGPVQCCRRLGCSGFAPEASDMPGFGSRMGLARGAVLRFPTSSGHKTAVGMPGP